MLIEEQEKQVLRFWPRLTEQEKSQLLDQIKLINFNVLNLQKQLLSQPSCPPTHFEPFTDFSFAGQPKDLLAGKQLVKEGRMGCLLLAGGQGTRLRLDGPKGRCPVSVIKHKTLFQLCAEKVLAASRQAERPLDLAIMTSPDNDEITKQYFKDENFFGLHPSQVSFFCQGTLPLLDAHGHLFLESPSRIAEGPYGNGQCLHDFYKSGIWQNWTEKGIQYVNLVLIDNPLADPFDAELLGFHVRKDVDITMKCTEKSKGNEKVGVVVKEGPFLRVIEYSELPDNEKYALQPNGSLKHRCANLSLLCFSMSFIEEIAFKDAALPLHKAWKAARFVNEEGFSQLSATPIAWKFETFIFDVFQYTDRVAALLYPREQCFAPLKNYSGEDSLETVQQALLRRDKQILKQVTGLEPTDIPFELAQDFYYPTPQLLEKWKKQKPQTSYVEP